jgi:GNAT superfamily N-acetyltransferase
MSAIIRLYSQDDRQELRKIYGMDEFARPKLLKKYPLFGEYLADEMSYYPDYEPESLFVADLDGQVVGALSGCTDTRRFETIYKNKVRRRLLLRVISGVYGWPGWLPAILYTENVDREVRAPKVDRDLYPAHLHISILPEWRRQGIGTALMEGFEDYLKSKSIPGYHLFASSFHEQGVAFYDKSSLTLLGEFGWRLHTGFEWVNVIEKIYVKRVI